MRSKILKFLFFFHLTLFATDFDCILVGTSPFSLFEALYQSQLGKKVLILEEANTCGGAWKSLTICGIPNVDLGCHQIGKNLELKTFLEEYAGCKLVCIDNPHLLFNPETCQGGYYFSQGSFELIHNLLKRIEKTDIVLRTNHKVDRVFIDLPQKIATVHTENQTFTTSKLIVTPMSSFDIFPYSFSFPKTNHYHLYLLIQDATAFRFTYLQKVGYGMKRIMNLTPFVNLIDPNQQLIAIQTHDAKNLSNPDFFLDVFKKLNLIDTTALLLQSEPYIYETGSFYTEMIEKMGAEEIVEVLQTGNFANLVRYLDRWKAGANKEAVANSTTEKNRQF